MTVDEFKEILCESAEEAVRMLKWSFIGDKDNPVEVWTWTDGIIDGIIRRNLRDRLIEDGRDPFTGKVVQHGKNTG